MRTQKDAILKLYVLVLDFLKFYKYDLKDFFCMHSNALLNKAKNFSQCEAQFTIITLDVSFVHARSSTEWAKKFIKVNLHFCFGQR